MTPHIEYPKRCILLIYTLKYNNKLLIFLNNRTGFQNHLISPANVNNVNYNIMTIEDRLTPLFPS